MTRRTGGLRVLWVSNDLPPRAGGIEQFVGNLLMRVHPTTTVVVGPAREDAAGHDQRVPYEVVRADGAVLPTPGVLRLVRRVAARHDPEVVVLGATWPLGELGGALRRGPGVPVVGLSHGLEAGLCRARLGSLVRRATRHLSAVTAVSRWSRSRLQGYVPPDRLVRLSPGVDVARFHPGADRDRMRRRWDVPEDAAVLGCVSRLVARKGQDVLLRVWPRLAARHPGAWLVLVGTGPLEDRLRRRAAVLERVRVVGEVSWEDLPGAHAALDVFALPCRTRWWGLDVEGLGIVCLEAQASGVPVVVGSSGGAPETVVEGTTGTVVEGRRPAEVARAIERLLADPGLRRRQGAAGRRHVEERWTWERAAGDLRRLLAEVVDRDPGRGGR